MYNIFYDSCYLIQVKKVTLLTTLLTMLVTLPIHSITIAVLLQTILIELVQTCLITTLIQIQIKH
jgi:hypothetical protein